MTDSAARQTDFLRGGELPFLRRDKGVERATGEAKGMKWVRGARGNKLTAGSSHALIGEPLMRPPGISQGTN